MLFITEQEAAGLVTLDDAIDAVEAAFAALYAGKAQVFPVVSAIGMSPQQQWAVKSGRSDSGAIGCKVGTYWPDNRARGLATHASTVLLLDPSTGYPAAVVQGSYLTALRTAAADAVAVKHLARPQASRLAVIGAGHQAWFDMQAIGLVRRLDEVRVWSRSSKRAADFAQRALAAGYPARPVELREALDGSDIVVTTTAATGALFPRDWISPGAHISAMGADAPGKQELPVELIMAARIFVDVGAQSVSIGECQTAYRAAGLDRARLIPIGGVIRGATPGRLSAEEVTVFDSSGIAIQDLAVCARAVTRAQATGRGRLIE